MNIVKTFILTIVIALLSLCLPVYGANEKEDNGEYSLVIYDLYGENDTPVVGATFKITKVADLSSKGEYELRSEYKSCGVTNEDINTMTLASEVNEVMGKLMGINDIGGSNSESYEACTDENGRIEITGLTAGLYLVTAVNFETQEAIFESSPSLISVPDFSGETAQYEVTVYAKTSASYSQATETESQTESSEESTEETETNTESQTEETEEGATETDDETESQTEGTETDETETPEDNTTEPNESETSPGESETNTESTAAEETEDQPEETENLETVDGNATESTESTGSALDVWANEETTPEESTESSGSGISQIISSILTGDNAPVLLLAVIALIAFIVIIIEIYFMVYKSRKEKMDKEGSE